MVTFESSPLSPEFEAFAERSLTPDVINLMAIVRIRRLQSEGFDIDMGVSDDKNTSREDWVASSEKHHVYESVLK